MTPIQKLVAKFQKSAQTKTPRLFQKTARSAAVQKLLAAANSIRKAQ